ncbi:MAG: hypothetical protein N3G19_00605 [Candidatus Pacearchaeota archaeon]|nr:hypothetical protein [Candidatus Pacearchaeota archaeon]
MFESLKSFRNEPEEECEECLVKDFLVDAIIDGKQKRICQHCVVANDAIVLKKPASINVEKIERDTVSEVMKRLTGIAPKRIERPQSAKLEDLRKRYEERKAKREIAAATTEFFKTDGPQRFEVLDEREFKDYIEKNPQTQSQPAYFQSSISQQSTTVATTKSIIQTSQPSQDTKISDAPLDFSPEATKRTTIRDLLEKMKLIIGRKETKEIEEKIDTETKEEKKEN